MNKESLLNELKNFIDSPYNIVLLDGPWGSGKTFLLHELIKDNKMKDIRFYYVSLHGLKNIDEINTALYMKVHGKTSKTVEIVPNVINPFGSEVDTMKTLEYLLKINKLKADKVVILDDLERYASGSFTLVIGF